MQFKVLFILFMETNIDDLKHIRSMMERSTKFLSLSGISGISAGSFALVGSIIAHFVVCGQLSFTGALLYDLILIALIVLICAACAGLYFSLRKAKRSKAKFWMPVTIQILKDFCVPMIVGGVFCIILITKNVSFMVAPSMLIFYGLALIYAGAHTYRDIKILGACEILLGLTAAIVVGGDLIFWGFGFGILHIVYGIVMYYKYETKSAKKD